MAKEGTAQVLVLVAGILAPIGLIFGLVSLVAIQTLTLIMQLQFLDSFLDPLGGSFEYAMFIWWVVVPMAATVLFVIFSLIFGILWLVWRKTPGTHRVALIVTGVLLLIFSAISVSGMRQASVISIAGGYLTGWGFLPGILGIVGGAIAPRGGGGA